MLLIFCKHHFFPVYGYYIGTLPSSYEIINAIPATRQPCWDKVSEVMYDPAKYILGANRTTHIWGVNKL